MSDALPLFPLPNVLLYPQALLPLQLFEPRYLQMMEDMLEHGQRRMVLASLAPGWKEEYFERPAVHDLAGVGTVLECRRDENGRFQILLRGDARARIVEEVESGRDYRRVRVRELEEPAPDAERAAPLHARLREALTELSGESGPEARGKPLALLADVLLAQMPVSAARRQDLFATVEPLQRARSVLAAWDEVQSLRRGLGDAAGGADPDAN